MQVIKTTLAGGLTTEKETLLTPREFRTMNHGESTLTPLVNDPNRRANNNLWVVRSPNTVQLVRERLRMLFGTSEDADRVYDNVITHCGWSEARAGGGNLVINGAQRIWL